MRIINLGMSDVRCRCVGVCVAEILVRLSVGETIVKCRFYLIFCAAVFVEIMLMALLNVVPIDSDVVIAI